MYIYLPIAEQPIHALVVLGIGWLIGVIMGMVGIGGGFLLTPLMIFFGIPSPVAVASVANQIVAPSVSGVLSHWKSGNVDIKMGIILLLGGVLGSSIGVLIFNVLNNIGQLDLVIKFSYFLFLSAIGTLMFIESLRLIIRVRKGKVTRGKLHQHNWLHGLPFKTRFRKSKLYISVLLPLLIGVIVGILAALMGIGGGFIIVPAMIYLLGMPTSLVVGTSLFQIIFVASNTTILQASQNQTVDIVLAFLLLLGSVIGVQFGSRFSNLMKGEHLRFFLSIIILLVGFKLFSDLITIPKDIFSIIVLK
ncbi:MAG: permease [SAR116 cluster bacterium]|jgi:uncharacterized membrane protein YfcA|nr:permease [SAR116 cluster bacterium]|tara:strand:- start:59 stop:973 length:915 start_codon:yes stop_codon:yes gene_type:complete